MDSCLARTSLFLIVLAWPIGSTRAEPVAFNRDVRPVLSRHCFKCHGPDDKARKAKMRLDIRAKAIGSGKSGLPTIVPGKPDASELIRRIFATDSSEVMPPPATKNPLSAAQTEVLRRWIAEGAEYQPHWAFAPPRQAPLPKVRQTNWPHNAIDYFVLARLEAAGLHPSPPADRYTLVRRLYLDLIGMPPTPEEADAFVNDRTAHAYERLVDRLLASPHYGERWARRWLDLARYADTNGYEKDRTRSIWPYRDWVIGALNADLHFDQFTIDQIAGDMLPGPTPSQRVATGFHRNTMLNEEGGIDPLEFRFYAMTDRVGTTASTWLGLTMGCAQCHTHKFDPISHREYYQFMAFMDNADEPEMPIPQPDIAARRAELQARIKALEDDLPNRVPPESDLQWHPLPPSQVTIASGATAKTLADGSVLLSGKNPDKDTYTIAIDSDLTGVAAVRLEALTDPSLSRTGPGRTPHGNFVLNEITVTAAPRTASEKAQPVKLVGAEADFAQTGFLAGHAIDGNPATGWAIQGPEPWNVPRSAIFRLDKPAGFPEGTRWAIRLDQQHGTQHTLGRFRLSLGQLRSDSRPLEVRRREHLERKFQEWQRHEAAQAVHWTILRPVAATSNMPKLTVLDDSSVLASGDMTKSDVYDLKFHTELRGITALRLEVLPHESLPRGGPGRIFYEGPFGDFFLSEITMSARGKPVRFNHASHSFASGGNSAANAIDGKPETAWMIDGGQGKAHAAVFNLAEPLVDANDLDARLLFERYYAAGLGRFRISVTNATVGQVSNLPKEAAAGQISNSAKQKRQVENLPHKGNPAARGLPSDIEELLLVPAERRTPEQRQQLLRHFLTVAPELAGARAEIQKLREQMPAYPTSLVLQERPADDPRPTFVHRRGEFLQPAERVEPDVPAVLPPMPTGAPHNRLTLARWLVDPGNPLVGRVTVNRAWQAFFGRGIVRTTADFGYQGEPPTHPELLDWLAVEFERSGWSIKNMHRLIVTSATYRQSSRVTPELLPKDPENLLLSRGSRFRIEAELIRDAVLKMSGLLASRIGGPSVFPPQPAGVTTDGTFGGMAWNVSQGPDRYRRGLYTFSKRTAPYAMFNTFDAPSGEACVARREVSNTPLQALTALNDPVFVEAAQALGRMLAAEPASPEARAAYLFRRCLTRPPSAEELGQIMTFYRNQRCRFEQKELDASVIAGSGAGDPIERAAWSALARVLLNLDETISKE
jgi:hypothetical protein